MGCCGQVMYDGNAGRDLRYKGENRNLTYWVGMVRWTEPMKGDNMTKRNAYEGNGNILGQRLKEKREQNDGATVERRSQLQL